MSNTPLFAHSLFRSASTYIFNKFRRHDDAFKCFQEPIHEFAFTHKDHPEILLSLQGGGEEQRQLNHPRMDRPYFQELYDTASYWRPLLTERMIYEDFFGVENGAQTVKYLNSFVAAASAKKTAFIQECRTPVRIGLLKELGLEGYHLALVRNPWDQWWSNKTTDYFGAIYQLLFNLNHVPPVIKTLRVLVNTAPANEMPVLSKIDFYRKRPLSDRDSYIVFFAMWCLSRLEAMQSANLIVDVDMLSNAASYQAKVHQDISDAIGKSPVFTDCRVPQRTFSAKERDFFEPLQALVFERLLQTGTSNAEIEILKTHAQPALYSNAPDLAPIIEVKALRDLVSSFESREIEILRSTIASEDRVQSAIEGNELLQSQKVQMEVRLQKAAGEVNAIKVECEKQAASLLISNEYIERVNADVRDMAVVIRNLHESNYKKDAFTAKLDAELTVTNHRLESTDTDLREITKFKADLEERLEQLDKNGEMLKSEILTLRKQKDEAETKVKVLNVENKTLKVLNADFSEENINLSKSLDMKANELRALQKVEAVTRADLKHLSEQLEHQKSSLRAADAAALAVKGDFEVVLKRHNAHMLASNEAEHHYRAQITELAAEINVLKEVLRSEEWRRQEVESALKRCTKTSEELLQEKQEKLLGLEGQITTLNDTVFKLRDSHNLLEAASLGFVNRLHGWLSSEGDDDLGANKSGFATANESRAYQKYSTEDLSNGFAYSVLSTKTSEFVSQGIKLRKQLELNSFNACVDAKYIADLEGISSEIISENILEKQRNKLTLKSFEDCIVQLNAELETLRSCIVEEQRQSTFKMHEKNAAIVELRHEIEALRGSRSWRLTSPIRWVINYQKSGWSKPLGNVSDLPKSKAKTLLLDAVPQRKFSLRGSIEAVAKVPLYASRRSNILNRAILTLLNPFAASKVKWLQFTVSNPKVGQKLSEVNTGADTFVKDSFLGDRITQEHNLNRMSPNAKAIALLLLR